MAATEVGPHGPVGVSASSFGSPAVLTMEDVTIQYPGSGSSPPLTAAAGASFTVAPEEFVTVVGPSGCGKSSLIMAIAGLVPITTGSIRVMPGLATETTVSGSDRVGLPFSVVFQQPRLMPWLSAFGNVKFALDAKGGLSRKQRVEIATRELRRVGLWEFRDAYPRALSGGMQQRVNLARALATEPDLLLLDEPLAALDAQTRELMQVELLGIWRTRRSSALFVTHQVDEALYLADRVIVMTARPARVKLIIDVPYGRPRDLRVKRSKDFLEKQDEIWDNLEISTPATTEPPAELDPDPGTGYSHDG